MLITTPQVKKKALDLENPQILLTVLRELRVRVGEKGLETYSRWEPLIARQTFQHSALNLAHYLALREDDLRSLQVALPVWGLSSLGRSEAHVLPNLDAVIATLEGICQEQLSKRPSLKTFLRGERQLQHNAKELLGKERSQRRIRIMVTLPTEAATDYDLVRDLLKEGMDCVRINCAHDNPAVWEDMIGNLRRAEKETGYSCKILMDLGGPKPRTGEILNHSTAKRLYTGDALLLTYSEPQPANQYPWQTNCTIPEVLKQLQVGKTVWLDDGKVHAQIERQVPEGFLLRILQVAPKGWKLKSGKGLNFPDTKLDLSPLTNKDLQDLDFVVKHADIIGYSFVQEVADIKLLQAELADRLKERANDMAIMAKIETQRAINNLPDLIVAAAGKQPFGVMIARGDLAVEIGFERLAEMQEEILWLCEAANVPVIWATQVLEKLVSKGIPSRGEMTDAAMSQRAEGVMLNKGPYIIQGVTFLNNVLLRMQEHQLKKTPQLRALRSWQK